MNLFLLLSLPGHAFLWIGLVNRLHAVGIRRRFIKILTAGCFACAMLIPVGIGRQYAEHGSLSLPIAVYVTACWAALAATLVRLAWCRLFRQPPPLVRFQGRQQLEINPAAAAANAGELAHHFLTRLPLNETLQLELTRWVLDVPRLTPSLDGLSIVHLSDLHFTGRVGKAYFREVVRAANELQPDLVCVTGDIIDRLACFDWIADTLGQLSARHGAYFILGNHDLSVDVGRLRRTLTESGLIDLGGRWLQVELRGTPVVLAGNERPWIASSADLQSCPPPAPTGPLRIALAHTPDQFAWARRHNVDLLLAGHTHGGQICIPPVGPILTPTAQGVKYISGVFYRPPTILHVSRGISGDVPVRWNCRPEIACLRLRAGAATL